jgi:flagellar hook-basal body complex protein FliE
MTVLPVGFAPFVAPTASTTGAAGATTGADAAARADFGDQLASSLDELDRAQKVADQSSKLAATGDAASIEAHMAALTEVQLATQLTVAVRNRAVESFNEIMRMQL